MEPNVEDDVRTCIPDAVLWRSMDARHCSFCNVSFNDEETCFSHYSSDDHTTLIHSVARSISVLRKTGVLRSNLDGIIERDAFGAPLQEYYGRFYCKHILTSDDVDSGQVFTFSAKEKGYSYRNYSKYGHFDPEVEGPILESNGKVPLKFDPSSSFEVTRFLRTFSGRMGEPIFTLHETALLTEEMPRGRLIPATYVGVCPCNFSKFNSRTSEVTTRAYHLLDAMYAMPGRVKVRVYAGPDLLDVPVVKKYRVQLKIIHTKFLGEQYVLLYVPDLFKRPIECQCKCMPPVLYNLQKIRGVKLYSVGV